MTIAVAYAQYYETKNELSISVGAGANSEILSGMKDFTSIAASTLITGIATLGYETSHMTYKNETYTVPIAVSYYRHLNKTIALGGYVAYNSLKRDAYARKILSAGGSEEEKIGTARNTNLSLMPSAKFHWVRTKNFGFYSKLGVGVLFSMEKQEADSHVTTDLGRIDEMFQIGLDNDDLLYAHLGDIADTKAEYYINLSESIEKAKMAYAEKYYDFVEIEDEKTDQHLTCFIDPATGERYMDVSDVPLPFYPVVGNHDITHNGWALWSSLFHSSFYRVFVLVEQADGQWILDRYFFLDTASGTLGREQVKLIEEDLLEGKELEQHNIHIRHTFVFSHTNIFRPSSMQFASTFPREETFFLLNQFKEWNASIVFCGHVHRWDEQEVGGVHYLTLDSMSEHNNPDAGDYLVRVHVKKDGTLSWERVRMNHVAKK